MASRRRQDSLKAELVVGYRPTRAADLHDAMAAAVGYPSFSRSYFTHLSFSLGHGFDWGSTSSSGAALRWRRAFIGDTAARGTQTFTIASHRRI